MEIPLPPSNNSQPYFSEPLGSAEHEMGGCEKIFDVLGTFITPFPWQPR